MKSYDYLVIGSGMFGATFARLATDRGKKVLVIDKRDHIAGNCFTQEVEGIQVHRYGPHLFHTQSEYVWEFLNRFTKFNHHRFHVKSRIGDKLFSIPPNMNLFHQLWGVTNPQEAREKIEQERIPCEKPANFEEYFLDGVGRQVYEMFFEGYTTKQWGRHPSKVPVSTARRLPIRFTWNDRYFNDVYEGIPEGGYTQMFSNMLDGIQVELGVDFFNDREKLSNMVEKIVYTGSMDEFFCHELGRLEYRSLRFEDEVVEGDFQGTSVINYPSSDIAFTRIVEHKHFEFKETSRSVITREYPADFTPGKTPYYTVNDQKNNNLHAAYKKLWDAIPGHLGGGRLFDYRYYDMDQTCASAMALARRQFQES